MVVALAFASASLFLTRPEYVVVLPIVIGVGVFRYHSLTNARYSFALFLLILLPTGSWIARNLSILPSRFRPLGVGSGMTLWIRSIELEEPNMAQRSARLANTDYRHVAFESDPSLLASADDRLRDQALVVLRERRNEYMQGALVKLLFREWVESHDSSISTYLTGIVHYVSCG